MLYLPTFEECLANPFKVISLENRVLHLKNSYFSWHIDLTEQQFNEAKEKLEVGKFYFAAGLKGFSLN